MLTLRSKLSLDSPESLVVWNNPDGTSTEKAFATNAFGKDTFSVDIYAQLNNFLRTLKIAEQRIIYDAYDNIRYILDNTINQRDLAGNLKPHVADISQIMSVERVYHWVKNYSDIKIPSGFDEVYEHDINNNKSLEKTYLRDDYIYLMAYCIILKIYVPIWGDYINAIRREIGTDFKEYNSFRLLGMTNYIDSKPYQKLLMYIEHLITDDMFNNYNIINNISSEDYSYYIFCLTNVRKLPFIEIKSVGEQEEDSKINIITFIYKFIKQKIKGNTNPTKMVKDKNTTSASIDENSKISVLEKYKIKTNISLEDIVELEYSVSNLTELDLLRLSSEIDPVMLNDAIRTSSVLNHSKIPDTSIRLLQWVFKPIISPRGIMYLSKPTLVRLLGILQAVLWARGFKELALLATTQKEVNDGYINVFSMDSKNRIPKEIIDDLDVLYPFNKPVKNGKAAKTETRFIINTIDSFAMDLSGVVLKMTASDQYIQEVCGNVNRKYVVNPDIKVTLARLMVQIGRRDWK